MQVASKSSYRYSINAPTGTADSSSGAGERRVDRHGIEHDPKSLVVALMLCLGCWLALGVFLLA